MSLIMQFTIASPETFRYETFLETLFLSDRVGL